MGLSRKLIFIVLISVVLVTIPATASLYYYYKDTLLDKEAKALQVDTDINIANVFRPILQEETKLNFLSQLLEKDLAASPESYEVKQFDEVMQQDADGAWRSKPETMSSAKSAGVFLPPDIKLDAKQKSLHLRSKKIIDAAVFGLNSYFNNLWLLTHDKTEVISDNLTPDFTLKMPADTDYTQTPWMTLGDPATNPSREMRWTEPSYDPVPKTWLISTVKPVDVDGVWIGNIGQDMFLQNIFAVLFQKNERYKGELHFLLDEHGHYLQAGPWQKALEANPDKFKADFSQASSLEKLFKQKVGSNAQVFEQQVSVKGQKYLAISTMVKPMNWRYYRLVPVNEILASLNNLFITLGIAIVLIGLLVGLLIRKIVEDIILSRFRTLLHKVHKQEPASFLTGTRLPLVGNADASFTVKPETEDDINLVSQGFDIALEQLKESERELQLLMDNMPATVARVNRELRYEYVNKQYERVFGKRPSLIIGQTMQELQGTAMFEHAKPYVQRALAGKHCSYERARQISSGETLIGLVHLIPNKDENQQVIGLFIIGIDITDVKKAEAEKEASRNLLKTIIDIAPVQIFWKDTNSRYMGGNIAFAQDAQLNDVKDLVGKLDADLLWKDSAKKFQQEDQEIIESGIAKLNYEHMLVRPNGEITWARSSKVPLKNLNGEIIGVLGVDENITEQKQLEAARLEEQKRLLKIASNVPGIIYQFRLRPDGTSCFPFASEAINYLFRVSPEEVREDASKVFAIIHPDDHDDIVTSIQISAKDLTLWREEFRVCYEDGTERWLFGSSSPEQEANGDVLWHGFITDITEQKRLDQHLKDSDYRWKFAIEGSGDGVWDVNVQTQEANYSKRWKEMLGYAEDELLADRKEWISRIHPDDRSNVLDAGQAYLEGKTDTYVVEYRLQCKDGQYKWMLSRGMLVSRDKEGKPLRMIGTQADITESKHADEVMELMQLELMKSHDRFKDLYEFAPIGYLTISKHGLITQLNWRASAMLGLDRKNIINQRITKFINEEEKPRWARLFHSIVDLEASEELSFDMKFTLHNGVSFHANLNCMRMDDKDEQSMLRVTLEDITMVKNSEIDLRIAATAFESQDGLMITDAENRILKVNKAFTDITGYTEAELVGKNPSVLSSGRHDATFYTAIWESINKTGRWSGEIWNRRKSGEVYPENLTISTVKNDLGVITNYVAANADISQMKAATEEIQQLAFFDSLTHLPNRRLLLDRLKHALAACARSGRQGAVLFLDLDHFKVLNDSLGHDVGDLLLQQVATRLTACVREGDTVARLGGDEYVVVLEDLSDQGFEAAAQTEIIVNKILAALNLPYELDIHEHHSTPSIGITVFDGHSATIEELLKQADIAMYQAKKAGRNTMRFFNPQMQTSITARVAIERELRKALENRQLHLHYQIQVDNLGHPLGAEALIRWIHPERGIVSPAQFIPLAEETGLILPIGNWVLDTACAQIKEWHQNPLTRDLTLSINVSAKQFRQTDFVAQVRAAIERHSIDPMQLKLELTESLLLENIEETIVSMTALGEIGVQFSLDDFGTGYSSLQYLKRLPLFQLKIDQSFVRDIVTDSHDRSIVRTIIAMAQSLYLNVIAEGVETEEQRALLLSNGCKRYQGYLFSKPVPIEQFEAVLKQIATKVSSKTNVEHI